MGVLSKLKDRGKVEKPKESVVAKKKREKEFKDTDIAKSLAMYIISAEILMAELIEENHSFVRIYDKFRQQWKLEDMINSFSSFDALFKAVYKETMRWLENERS